MAVDTVSCWYNVMSTLANTHTRSRNHEINIGIFMKLEISVKAHVIKSTLWQIDNPCVFVGLSLSPPLS